MRSPAAIQQRLISSLAAAVLLLVIEGCAFFGGSRGWEPRYEVESGDTLYSIAWAHGLDYRELAAWNDIKPPYTIRTGEMLRLTAPEGFVYYPPDERGTGSQAAAKPASQPPVTQDKPPAAAPVPRPGESPVFTREPDVNAPAETARAEPATPIPAPPSAENLKWRWPVQGEILRSYAPDDGNSGLDIGGTSGQPIRAAANGKVVYGGSGLKGYGLLVIVKHDDNYLSAYGYNRKLLVQQGDEVHIGQPIAEMGEGPQQKALLHFEVRRSGKTVDPMLVLPAKP